MRNLLFGGPLSDSSALKPGTQHVPTLLPVPLLKHPGREPRWFQRLGACGHLGLRGVEKLPPHANSTGERFG